MTDTTDLHSAAVQRALALLGPDPADWVTERPGIDTKVAIIGAGQSGLALAFALRRAGVGGVRLFDAEPEGAQGIWATRARMPTLRTPKLNPGPELGIGELGFQAWYEREYGAPAFAALTRAATADWDRYLTWYRGTLGLEVSWNTRLTDIEPAAGGLRLTLIGPAGEIRLTTRKLVLATGFTGGGGGFVPELIAKNVPPSLRAHSIDRIDPAHFRGKRVGVIGASASAFDQAGTALEHCASEVRLFSRRPDLVRVARFISAGYPGGDYIAGLPDAERWKIAAWYLGHGSPPPIDSVLRSTRHDNFHLHLSAPLEAASAQGRQITLTAGGESFGLDFLVTATGFAQDLSLRPELAGLADHVATWGDRYTPSDDAAPHLLRAPYLGADFALQEKTPGSAPHLADIHLFNGAGFVSFGRILGDISSIRRLIPRLSDAIAASLFAQDRDAHLQRLRTDLPPEGLEEAHFSHRVWQARTAISEATP